jgi:hypothetical protein
MRNALQYSQVLMDLFNAIDGYKSECENPVPCHIMKKVHLDNIFAFHEEIKSMAPNYQKSKGDKP